MEEDESVHVSDEMLDRDDATLDQAPSIHSADDEPLSWADVSLQTGQSLMTEQKPIQLTKQTSTSQIPELTFKSMDVQSKPIQVSITDTKPSQETIKILKTANDTHDVIEIATKNIPSTSSQQFIMRERMDVVPDDIVVDMKYQDAKLEKNASSELNIQHAAPQTFETVLVEPDDVTTEVVVDADGTKRIIVRKLRKTLVTTNQFTQQHISSVTGAIDDAQAFSEATMRGQQVTITRTRPDGSVEVSTKQTYGGKVMTGDGTAGNEVNIGVFEVAPQYTQEIIQGAIADQPEINDPARDFTVEGSEYQTQTSTVHAMVQQVTRRVIRKTRRTIRKVTIIDGKETTSEEVIEEPEEIEIDDQNIPHISINVVKQDHERSAFQRGVKVQDPIKSAQSTTITEFPAENVIEEFIEISEPDNAQSREVNEYEGETQQLSSQVIIDTDESGILQPAAAEIVADKIIIEPPVLAESEVMAETTCKSIDALVKSEPFDIAVETGTVEVEQHSDGSSTVELADKSAVIVIEEQEDGRTSSQTCQEFMGLDQGPTQLSGDDFPEQKTPPVVDEEIPRDVKNVIEKVEISLLVQNQEDFGPSVSVKTQAERPGDTYQLVKKDVDIRLPKNVETREAISQKPAADPNTTITENNKTKKIRREPEDNAEKPINEESGSSIASTIALSMDINLPSSESPKQISEQPQPDIMDVTETSLTLSSHDGDTLHTGYVAEDGTVEEVSITQEADDKRRKRKKKMKRKKVQNAVDDDAVVSQSTSHEMTIPGKISKTDDNECKQQKQADNIEATTVEPIEKSPVLSKNVQEQEMQTSIHEEMHSEVQTSPIPLLDFGNQTEALKSPDIEHSSIQTEPIMMDERGYQTSPLEIPAGTKVTETEEVDVQTAIDVDSTGIQTLPLESAIMSEVETQTLPIITEGVHFEQQTTPPPPPPLEAQAIIKDQRESTMQTSSPEVIEVNIQTSKPASPEVPTTENIQVQANLIEEIDVAAMETQTTPRESPRVSTEEIQVQTDSPEPTVESVMQTSPLHEDVTVTLPLTIDLGAQTSFEETKITTEEESQTMNPEKIATIEKSLQVIPDTTEISLQTLDIKIQDEPVRDSETSAHQPIITDSTNAIEQTTEDIGTPSLNQLSSSVNEPTVELAIAAPNEPNVSAPVDVIKHIANDLPKTIEKLTKTETPIISEKDLTSDSSLEIHVQATIELSDASSILTSESTDITDDNTIVQKSNEVVDPAIDKTRKRGKKNKKHKPATTRETNSSNTSHFMHGSITNDSVAKPSYSAITKKGMGETHVTCNIDEGDYVTFGRVYTDQKGASSGTDANVSVTIRKDELSEQLKDNDKIKDKVTVSVEVQHSLATRRQQDPLSAITIDNKIYPEPMDTSEELFSPTESILAQENKPETKTYAEIISGLEPKTTPGPSTSTSSRLPCETMTLHRSQPVIQKTQATRVMLDRLKNVQNAKVATYLSNILHIATLEDISMPNTVQERAMGVQKDLTQLKNAVEEQNIIVTEKTLITIVETISTWLETIEYRIFLGKESPAGPTYESSRNFVELRDELNHLKGNINELGGIWKDMETKYPKDECQSIKECVDTLASQVEAIENVACSEEQYTASELTRWDEFLNGVNNVYR